ncbi:MAG: hypothetical protein ING91_19465 [Rhodocyclaceae bacterium]|nr:hypothetical protein [Rhodocyclaceae bacterium]MCA3116414.1 hypothetical protein [Rhodocyclaceae bacterium]
MKQPLLSRINDEGILSCLACMCLSKALLAAGTTAGTYRTTNAINFTVDGVLFARAAADNLAFTTANLAVHGPSQRRAYLVQIDAEGNFSTKQGAPFDNIPAPGGGNENGVAYTQAQGVITALSNAFLPRVTSAAHGRQTGDTVMLNAIVGPSILNGMTFPVRRVDANNFDLMMNADGRALPGYVSGGAWMEMELVRTAIGAIFVETNSSTTFTPGTTSLNAAGVTATYMDFALLPPVRRQ